MIGFSKKYIIWCVIIISILLFFVICKSINYRINDNFIIENFELWENYYEKRDKSTFSKPAIPSFGINIWSEQFNEQRKLFNERYKPNNLPNMPNYPERYTLSGIFIDEGPIESNTTVYN
jgi:hypothetical protein